MPRICTRRISEFQKSRMIRTCWKSSEPSNSPRLCPTPVENRGFCIILDTTNTNEIIAKLTAELPDPAVLQSVRSIPAEFEKDDDANHHIDFIAACANLRAAK